MQLDGRKLMADAKFYESYSRWDSNKGRYETWGESVDRVMNMHRTKYADKMIPELSNDIDFCQSLYEKKAVLGAQRALQFGGEQLLKNNLKLYNCVSSHLDRPEFFGEFMELLLSGCGAGFSVQKHHIEQLPPLKPRSKTTKTHIADDSIEGWATAFDVLFSSFFVGGGKHPEYAQHPVFIDLKNIRPKGAMISGGFKAPGPEPLRKALDHVETILNKVADEKRKLKPIEAYDCCMHMADAVISGGVRRSACIALISKDDDEMIKAKTGDWFISNPQRGRSNNSAMLLRDEITFEEFQKIMESVQHSGDPGFIFTDNLEFTYNPCVS